jgi:hypothetical protein
VGEQVAANQAGFIGTVGGVHGGRGGMGSVADSTG